jgi:glutamine synthetase type III
VFANYIIAIVERLKHHADQLRHALDPTDAPEVIDKAADTISELVEALKEARNYVEACSVYVKEKRGGRGWWTCDQLLANCDALLAKLEAGEGK